MALLTNKKATSRTPQVVTLIVDDSRSMREPCDGGKSKAEVATEALQNLVMATQANTQGSRGFRFLLNVARFGDRVTPIAEAQPPREIDLEQLVFLGESGWTNMAQSLEWATGAVEQALTVCRALPSYDESKSPSPLVVFLSDGENTGHEVATAAHKLRSIQFKDGTVAVIACGIGMKPEHFDVMRTVASNPEFAVNIDPARLAEFIAGVGATVVAGSPNINIVVNFTDEWDGLMARGRAALEAGDFPSAETAFTAALEKVRDTPDHRHLSSLTSLANLHALLGDGMKALPFCNQALGMVATLGPTTVLPECAETAEKIAELLQIADQKQEAQDLWAKIAIIWERPEAASWADRAGKWCAVAFRHQLQGRDADAEAAFTHAVRAGGTGSAAALKALATIHAAQGSAASEPYLERLVEHLITRFGPRSPVTAKTISELRMVYLLGDKTDKLAKLRELSKPGQ